MAFGARDEPVGVCLQEVVEADLFVGIYDEKQKERPRAHPHIL